MHDPTLPVGSVARLAGVTVRTLHHYDAIGLLRPSGRAENGYRRYTATDVERLQRILFYRELGFGLDRIKDAMADPAADPLTHLREQHALLLERTERLQRLAGAVTRAMEAHTMGIDLSPEHRLQVFGSFDPEAHAEEARERWGSTDAYRESARRTRGYTKADWRIGAEGGRRGGPLRGRDGGGPAPGQRRGDGGRRGPPCPYRPVVLPLLARDGASASPSCT